MRFLVSTKNSIIVMRITLVCFVNVTCTYSNILVKWVSFLSCCTNLSIFVVYITKTCVSLHSD